MKHEWARPPASVLGFLAEVEVCVACKRASCAQGIFLCPAVGARTIKLPFDT